MTAKYGMFIVINVSCFSKVIVYQNFHCIIVQRDTCTHISYTSDKTILIFYFLFKNLCNFNRKCGLLFEYFYHFFSLTEDMSPYWP